jgi:hypothetical protein
MVLPLLVCFSCAKVQTAPTHTDEFVPAPWNLSREGFIQEAVFPEGSPRTPYFDDYTEGSYHVDKIDMVNGIREMRKKKPEIIAAFIGGPWGMLWNYDFLVFMKTQSGEVKVGRLVFPHARIVYKSTTTIPRSEFNALSKSISSAKCVAPGYPTIDSLKHGKEKNLPLEWQYDFLFAVWGLDNELLFHATDRTYPSSECVREVTDVLSKFTDKMAPTYTNELPEGFDMVILPKDKKAVQ